MSLAKKQTAKITWNDIMLLLPDEHTSTFIHLYSHSFHYSNGPKISEFKLLNPDDLKNNYSVALDSIIYMLDNIEMKLIDRPRLKRINKYNKELLNIKHMLEELVI